MPSVSLDAHCLSTGIQAEPLTPKISSFKNFKSHFGNVSAGLWYIKHECDRYTSTKSPCSLAPYSNSMTLVVSNDPSWWPVINANVIFGYFVVAASVGVMYDWALTFGQEVELMWRQRWSLMTFLYLSVRYVGIGYAVYVWKFKPLMLLSSSISHNQDEHFEIANVVMLAITMMQSSAEEYVLSGTYQCIFDSGGDSVFLASMTWILDTVWEVLALCLAVWIAVKHFRELRQHSTRGIIGDCFTVLMKTHVSYFASFLAISCFEIGFFSPTLIADLYSLDTRIYQGFAEISGFVGFFVLGPRLILGVREYHAELVANSDTATAMTSIAFQERIHVSTSSSV
ncbi:hypothetical protein DFJ58DRAFT_747559 [Suillus subalutaceus]|uniref:uncharacterized protein n=1 Tax=Suillus subalutaceus TaxID=48586 RepID=UPI001B85D9C0|nr:uncharacterized protein DFJ58DRAFT_747559 [Suillus subalutaceus]KAG1844799.1 hypothetical protein DFJ58DRAFT_747559 [Suillus subalutaceus]